MHFTLLAAGIFAAIQACKAEIVESFHELHSTEFDFVIIGGKHPQPLLNCLADKKNAPQVEPLGTLLRIGLRRIRVQKFSSWRRGARKYNQCFVHTDCCLICLRPNGVLNLTVPYYCLRATPNTPNDWNYTTVPLANVNNRSISIPRGHVLGGSSSVSECR